MIGISIAARREWEYTLQHYKVNNEDIKGYLYSQYFLKILNGKELVFYYTGVRKVNASGANQYMISKFSLKKIIVVGTCAGIDNKYKVLDIIIPNIAYQYDCTVREIEPLLKEKYKDVIDLSQLNFKYNTGSIGTADKAVVMWNDYQVLKENGITIADTESAAIVRVCKMNNVNCVILKGISDFPKNIDYQASNSFNNAQYNEFIDNVPTVMKTIYDDYLDKVI